MTAVRNTRQQDVPDALPDDAPSEVSTAGSLSPDVFPGPVE